MAGSTRLRTAAAATAASWLVPDRQQATAMDMSTVSLRLTAQAVKQEHLGQTNTGRLTAALPPSLSTRRPASVASGELLLTMPLVLCTTLRLLGKCMKTPSSEG